MSKRYVEVDSEEDLEELENLGTSYSRKDYKAVSTIVGGGKQEVVFVYVRNPEGLETEHETLGRVVEAMNRGEDDES